MAETYKAVFTCPELKERRVWWVSSRTEAKRHLFAHVNSRSHRKRIYEDHKWEFKVRPIFASDSDTGCDHSTFE